MRCRWLLEQGGLVLLSLLIRGLFIPPQMFEFIRRVRLTPLGEIRLDFGRPRCIHLGGGVYSLADPLEPEHLTQTGLFGVNDAFLRQVRWNEQHPRDSP